MLSSDETKIEIYSNKYSTEFAVKQGVNMWETASDNYGG